MRILLIEDDKDVAEAMKAVLSKHFVVDLSFTGKSGTYKSHLKDYQLIILDYGSVSYTHLPSFPNLSIVLEFQ